jgi:hypothetical protein
VGGGSGRFKTFSLGDDQRGGLAIRTPRAGRSTCRA